MLMDENLLTSHLKLINQNAESIRIQIYVTKILPDVIMNCRTNYSSSLYQPSNVNTVTFGLIYQDNQQKWRILREVPLKTY